MMITKRNTKRTKTGTEDSDNDTPATPEETLENAYEKIRSDLATELLQRLKSSSPAFFERLVVEAIVKMGYGGTRQDAGKAIGRSGDGGIDGETLAELMIDHNVGVSTIATYDLKKIDSDYFTEE